MRVARSGMQLQQAPPHHCLMPKSRTRSFRAPYFNLQATENVDGRRRLSTSCKSRAPSIHGFGAGVHLAQHRQLSEQIRTWALDTEHLGSQPCCPSQASTHINCPLLHSHSCYHVAMHVALRWLEIKPRQCGVRLPRVAGTCSSPCQSITLSAVCPSAVLFDASLTRPPTASPFLTDSRP